MRKERIGKEGIRIEGIGKEGIRKEGIGGIIRQRGRGIRRGIRRIK